MKSRLPGGFAAQPVHGTGRRKCAIARVVLQEGTGKVIINYRDANVNANSPSFLTFCISFLSPLRELWFFGWLIVLDILILFYTS